MVSVVITLVARPGFEEKVIQLLVSILEIARTQSGLLQYNIHREVEQKDTFVIYESWAAMADFERHATTPDVEALALRVRPCLRTAMRARILEEIAFSGKP